MLLQEPDGGRTLIRSGHDDVLRLVDLSQMPRRLRRRPRSGWAGRLLALVSRSTAKPEAGDQALAAARDECDVVLHVCSTDGDRAAAAASAQWLGKPVLVLVNRPRAGRSG